jgi:pyridoxal phosphate enzyme (YggS family)
MNTIEENLKEIRLRIKSAALKAGRNADEITLVAVSKRHSAEYIKEAYHAGQRDFGENYAQELRDKAALLEDLKDIKWHFIGNLQRNKVKYVAPCVDMMETVDSVKLLNELSKQAEKLNREIQVLIQVNVGNEPQKSGCSKEMAKELVSAAQNTKGIILKGLMTIPPFHLKKEETRVHFKDLADLREQLGGSAVLPHLSMGMSSDFEVAIEEGATLVRVGTAIFGERPARVMSLPVK